MTPADRVRFREHTAAAREKALASAPPQITAASRRTLEYLIHGSSPQQESGAA
jgi:hypothetical protein